MLLALDVHYREEEAKAVGVLFHWKDPDPQNILIEYISEVDAYIPGLFYKRELPCLIKIIEKLDISELEGIIVDGYIYVDNDHNYGLGGKLYEILENKIPIIGVAKTPFYNNKETVAEIKRGESNNPLYISAIGIDLSTAAQKIRDMYGTFRIPNILKTLDQITKSDNN
ncbi:endonuclease V [Epilithonimonas caeni]|uniref:endonuclease V n=1 Tax=Epilithonimonas caeni TaxID=365343 RepID=UPI0003FE4151|nr:endonuclease V [Epilithonimonas caeni]